MRIGNLNFKEQFKRKYSRLKNQAGLTLAEVGLAVAVSAIIVVVALVIYESTNNNAKLLAFNTQVAGVRAEVANTLAIGGTIDATFLSDHGYKNNPWGGALTIQDNGTGTYDLSGSRVPDSLCTRMSTTWESQVAGGSAGFSCSGGTFSMSFNY